MNSSAPGYRTPVFNLKAVVQETGIKGSTLRAWERRYGLPQPSRTSGGHRIYSQRDVDVIRWLSARQEEGLSIGRAVDLWRRLEAEGRSPLQARSSAAPVEMPSGEAMGDLRQAWISACLAFNRPQAEQIMAQAFALYPPETVCLRLLREGVAQIGRDWYEGRATVQQEHFASALALQQLDALIIAAPPPTRSDHILVACPPGEAHVFPLTLLAFLLRRQGWEVTSLGADVPLARMASTVETIDPQLVILAAQRLYTAATLLEMGRTLRQKGMPFAFGGAVFNRLPALRSRIPGYFLGPSLDRAPEEVEQLLSAPPLLPAVAPSTEEDQQAQARYREQRPLIEADLWRALSSTVPRDCMTQLSEEFGRNVAAALALGDIRLLDDYVEWIAGLCGEEQVPPETLLAYLEAYARAAEAHLAEEGKPLVDWLAEQAAQERDSV